MKVRISNEKQPYYNYITCTTFAQLLISHYHEQIRNKLQKFKNSCRTYTCQSHFLYCSQTYRVAQKSTI